MIWGISVCLVCLVFGIICGFLSSNLQYKKGYEGGFLIGFLLGVIGLIYSAGLPDINKKKIKKQPNNEIVLENEIDEDGDEDSDDFSICKNCGMQIFADEKICSKCGQPKK